MKIKITRKTVRFFALTGRRDDLGDRRRYYVARQAANRLVIVVCRNNLELTSLIGETVDASVGWDYGTRGFVHDRDVGRRHTKLTIYRKSRSRAQKTLARIVRDAPGRETRR